MRYSDAHDDVEPFDLFGWLKRLHLFHKWRPVKAWDRIDGFQCLKCGEKKLKFERYFIPTWLNLDYRKQAYDWLNEKEGELL